MPTLISIQKATVKQFDKVVFENLDFQWEMGQHWAILGQSGNGAYSFFGYPIRQNNGDFWGLSKGLFLKNTKKQKSELRRSQFLQGFDCHRFTAIFI
jgi:ABC-type transporter Mla maintaining outer membrane lipid asymmetry ATPase subunit MlaF